LSQIPPYFKITVFATLIVVILTAVPTGLNLLQWGIAQEQQQPQRQQAAHNVGKPTEDLSFDTDNNVEP
jgi:hypothetical protein